MEKINAVAEDAFVVPLDAQALARVKRTQPARQLGPDFLLGGRIF
jgi:hypothetical protein